MPGCIQPSTTVDHRIPLSKGGERLARTNLQGMCASHNYRKGARLPMTVNDRPKKLPKVLRDFFMLACDYHEWPQDGCPHHYDEGSTNV